MKSELDGRSWFVLDIETCPGTKMKKRGQILNPKVRRFIFQNTYFIASFQFEFARILEFNIVAFLTMSENCRNFLLYNLFLTSKVFFLKRSK